MTIISSCPIMEGFLYKRFCCGCESHNQGSFSLRPNYRRETKSMAAEARPSITDASIVAYWSNQTETSEFVFRDLKKLQLEDPDETRIVLDFSPECQLSITLLGTEKVTNHSKLSTIDLITRTMDPGEGKLTLDQFASAHNQFQNVLVIAGDFIKVDRVNARLRHRIDNPSDKEALKKFVERLKAILLTLVPPGSKILIGCPTGNTPMALVAMMMADSWKYCLDGNGTHCFQVFWNAMVQVYLSESNVPGSMRIRPKSPVLLEVSMLNGTDELKSKITRVAVKFGQQKEEHEDT